MVERWSAFCACVLALSCGGVATNGIGLVGDAGNQDATTGGACVPGQQVACACVGGGVTGVQTCKPGGDGFAECLGCPAGDDAAADDGPGGDAGYGSGPDGGDAAPPRSDGGCASLSVPDNCG